MTPAPSFATGDEPATTGHLQGAGLGLLYREWNAGAAGEPIVLLHGITGSSADWLATARHFEGRRIIAFDARGHGGSDWDPDEAYGGDQHFADLATALDTLGIERCTLAGFSMGGGVAIIAAGALPERIARVVVIDAYPHPEMTPGSRRIARWISSYAGSDAWFDPAIARHFRQQLAAGRDARLDLWPLWEAIQCPALVVRGALSDVLPVAVAEEMVERQRLARLITIPGVAHRIPFAKPGELAAAIMEFIG